MNINSLARSELEKKMFSVRTHDTSSRKLKLSMKKNSIEARNIRESGEESIKKLFSLSRGNFG